MTCDVQSPIKIEQNEHCMTLRNLLYCLYLNLCNAKLMS